MTSSPPQGPPLLLISCSQRKAVGLDHGRAWDIYDGQLFRILKNLRRERPWREDELRILIVSARHGILEPNRVITTYDQRMTIALALRTRDRWGLQLRRAVVGYHHRAVHVNLGQLYLDAVPDLADMFPGIPIDRATGGIGSRNAQTRRWVLEQLHVPSGTG